MKYWSVATRIRSMRPPPGTRVSALRMIVRPGPSPVLASVVRGVSRAVGSPLPLRDVGGHISAPIAGQLVGPHAGQSGPDLDLDEPGDLSVVETGAPRVVPPVSPGPAVGRSRIAID